MEYVELEVWKEARILVNSVYRVSKDFPKNEMYGLTLQIRKCAVSIPSNIAEGSLYELETQLYIALDQEYLKEKDFEMFLKQILKCKKLINGFIKYYKNNN